MHIYSTSGTPAIAPPVDTLQDVHGLEGAFINKIDLPGQVTHQSGAVNLQNFHHLYCSPAASPMTLKPLPAFKNHKSQKNASQLSNKFDHLLTFCAVASKIYNSLATKKKGKILADPVLI